MNTGLYLGRNYGTYGGMQYVEIRSTAIPCDSRWDEPIADQNGSHSPILAPVSCGPLLVLTCATYA